MSIKLDNMKQYKYLEHTADVEFVAFGKNLESCFKNALMAMFDTISYLDKVASSKSKNVVFKVEDKANSLEDLLWYALQDTLSIADSRSIFAYKVPSIKIKIKEFKRVYEIRMTVVGKPRENSASKLDVKGVSRYNLGIKKTRKGTEATVVLDV